MFLFDYPVLALLAWVCSKTERDKIIALGIIGAIALIYSGAFFVFNNPAFMWLPFTFSDSIATRIVWLLEFPFFWIVMTLLKE